MSTASVVFDLPTLIQFGWSPSEMKALCPAINIIHRSPIYIEAPVSLLTRVRPSMSAENFETFRWFMTPTRLLDSCSVANDISISVISDVGEERSGFGESPVKSVMSMSSREGECYRLSVTINGFRQYSVSRSAAVVFATIKVTRHVFPELLLPLVERIEEIDVIVTDAFCSCLVNSIVKLRFFVPILFFLFETSNSAISSLITHALSTVNTVQKQHHSESTWSFWSKKVYVPTLEDDEKFIKSYSHRFLKKPTPFSVFTQCKVDFEASSDLQIFASRLATTLGKEENALNTVLSSLESDFRTILSLSPSFMVEENVQKNTKVADANSKDINRGTVPDAVNDDCWKLELPQPVQISSILDMIRCPSSYMMWYSQASLSLVRQVATISRQIINSSGPKASALQAVLDSLEITLAEQVEFSDRKRRQAMQQLCVLIYCLIHRLGNT